MTLKEVLAVGLIAILTFAVIIKNPSLKSTVFAGR